MTHALHPTLVALQAAPGGISMYGFAIQMVALFAIFYFLMIRPQQRRMKTHAAMLAAIKRGDTVVLPSGVIGKVVRVEDKEVGVEIATGVTVKAVKSMISEVRTRGEPAPANDSKN